MKSYLLAHSYWETILKKGDITIDATLGNGYDTLILARLVGKHGKVFSYDIQREAIMNAATFLKKNLNQEDIASISLIHGSHESFTQERAKLIVYNLGYLPGGDKKITTKASSTLESLNSACKILEADGSLSVMCYTGHEEGKLELEALQVFFRSLPKEQFLVCQHTWINRKDAPILFMCKKVH